ncbi:acyl-CoA dehydrogenase [Shimia biformata]|uniref:acyl-CoA dehydrogenase n=1 Tax=Shimia biformata TaxID=1294299 RepID=UPI00194E0FBE|nr:acyl-CoA dehydrogenase [Shimia biformata]
MAQFVDRQELDFLLFDVMGMDRLTSSDRYAAYDHETAEAILDSAQAIAAKHFEPIAAEMDANEPRVVDGKVVIQQEAKEALAAYAEAGFFAAGFDEGDGGMQMPKLLSLAVSGLFTCANNALANYAFLTQANAAMLRAFGSPEQVATYLPPMLEGRWFGTMCLSEPQAGSSLSDITTKAEPQGDGTYRISGTKMWISGGDHELSENIVHMVLAKIPGGAPGVKGISLFLVPRYRVDENGQVGDWNNITLGGLNHKMGQRGTTNCLLNFSDGGDTIGTLVGAEGAGMAAMFHMMNEARLAVGHGAAMCGLGGYLASLQYARERLQGRHPLNKDATSPQLPIIDHADVRRMLLAQKTAVEGATTLTSWCAALVDRMSVTDDPDEQKRLNGLLDVLTPIAKSWPSEHCLEANKHAIQILGGYGYTRDFPMERFYRDNRLNHIHEGTYAIHGLDLLGRKVRMRGGADFIALLEELDAIATRADAYGELKPHVAALRSAIQELSETTRTLCAEPDVNRSLANATLYLNTFGHVVIAALHLWRAETALTKRGEDDAFRDGVLASCRYFFAYELPKTQTDFAFLRGMDDTCLTMRDAWFGNA